MPLFRQSLIQKHTPKTIKLPNLYKHLLRVNYLNNDDKINIIKALQMSGYDYSAASKILSGRDLNISKAKEVADGLSKIGLAGFTKNDTNRLVDKYVRSEAIKRKNLAGRRGELMMESRREDIDKSKIPYPKYSKKSSNTSPKVDKDHKIKLGF